VPLVIGGWTILYHPVFGDRLRALKDRVKQLKATLPPVEFARHPDLKLLSAVNTLISKTIPADPNAREFMLKANLSKFRRVKGHGLAGRHRMFYVFMHQSKTIIFLYLNDSDTLRKDGAKTDPYEVFKNLVESKNIGKDFDANLKQWKAAHSEQR